ncbi:MAG: hypothetical protein AB7S57_19825 [Acetobacteraceae bacterium]
MSVKDGSGAHAQEAASAHASAVRFRSIVMLAGAAVILALAEPFWGPLVLGSLNQHPAEEQRALQSRETLVRMERQIDELDRKVTATAGDAARVKAGVAQVHGGADQTARAMASLAITELGAALRQNAGFMNQLAAARAVMKATPELAELVRRIEPYAETGIPGRDRLRRSLAQLQPPDPAGDSSPLAIVRRVIGVPGSNDPIGLAIADADRHLRDDDLAGAMTAMRALPEPRTAGVEEWLDDTAARLAADTLIRRVEELTAGRDGKGGRS